MGPLTMVEAWHRRGGASIPVRNLPRPRVAEAQGECPILYYPAECAPAQVEYWHGWALPQLYRLRYGDRAFLHALCDYDAIHAATWTPDARGDFAAD